MSKPLPDALEVVLYPVHLMARVTAKILVFLAAVFGIFAAPVGALLLPLLVAIALWGEEEESLKESLEKLLENLANLTSAPLFGVVTALGLLGSVVKIANRSALDALRDIGYEFRKMKRCWMPPRDVRRSFAQTRKPYLAKVVPTTKKMWSLSLKFFFALVLLGLLSFCFYAQVGAEDELKKKVESVWKSVGEIQARTGVVVVAGGVGAANGLTPSAIPFNDGDIYAIAHVEQGSLKYETTGICLDDHVSLPWLRIFKAGLKECAEKMAGCRPAVTVQGFASKAPVRNADAPEGAASTVSQTHLNCEIANRRAEEVVHFLVSKGDYECQAHEHQLPPFDRRDPCRRGQEEYQFGDAQGLAFDVHYRPWRPPEAMIEAKPADDGKRPGERRHKVEFFNRAVQLTLRNYGCELERCKGEQPKDEESSKRDAGLDGSSAGAKPDDPGERTQGSQASAG